MLTKTAASAAGTRTRRPATGGAPRLSPALEDCLEAVSEQTRLGRPARVRDLARRLGVRMPTVTVALRRLAVAGLVDYQRYGGAVPTAAGRRAGRRVESRHQRLARFLTDALGVAATTAQATACRLEHAIDEALLRRLEKLAVRAAGAPPVPGRCREGGAP